MELVHRQGTTVVMATHDLATAKRLETSGRRIDLDGQYQKSIGLNSTDTVL